jgi:fructose-1,6-bisphosphatase/inositol monophosphatase family enzyme
VDDLELAAGLVREAGELADRMLREGLTVQRKTSISDVVSAADHAAEDLIVKRLRTERPDDAIVGEEGTADSGTGRTWYVDPVDGTYNFVWGLPLWCAAIALDEALGAIFHPASDELWLGGHGHPTTRNGQPLAPLTDRHLADVSISTYVHPTTLTDDTLRVPLLRVMGRAATVRMLGSGSIELAAVAAGRLGVSVQANSLPWDWLPGAALVRAAGGAAEVVETEGHRWHVAGSRRVVSEVSDLLCG